MSVAAAPWADLVSNEDERAPCAWPECDRPAEAQGFCLKHAARVRRGSPVGVESAREGLVVAALELADAEEDLDFVRALAALEEAARRFARSPRPGGA